MKTKDIKLINLTFLREFCHDDPVKMVSYIHMFLESAPEQLELIKKYTIVQNWYGVKIATHSLKPLVAFMGISSIEPLIEQIEEYTISEDPSQHIPVISNKLDLLLGQAFSELIETLVTLS